MAYTTINKSTDYFNTTLYNGTGSAGNVVTGTGFNADLTWIKRRNSASSHMVYDKVRGVQKNIRTDTTAAESAGDANNLNAWSSDGFTVGSSGYDNGSGGTFVSWNWKANGAGSANTDGSINTTYTSVNTTAGFSISTYTGTGSAATVGHGLGVVPKMIITKNISTTTNWHVYHEAIGATKYLHLNLSNAEGTASSVWNNTAPTSSVFSIGTGDGTNKSGDTIVAYCFAEKTGYSKFGSYNGNGNADGTFVYTGFKPAFILCKDPNYAAENWFMFDNKRPGYNVNANLLYANDTATETTSGANQIDLLSNGFKMRATNNGMNRSGSTFIYMAFGQSLVGSNNVPCTAR
jgi:hypothetical protein